MELWNEIKTAATLGVSPYKLRADRHYRRGLPFIRVGRRVLYRPEDVKAFIDQNRIEPEGRAGRA